MWKSREQCVSKVHNVCVSVNVGKSLWPILGELYGQTSGQARPVLVEQHLTQIRSCICDLATLK